MDNTELLVESKTMRESVISRVEILDKVKKLHLLPDDIHLTIELGANYYEVHKDAIEKVIREHRRELEADGLKLISGEALSAYKAETGFSIRAGKVIIFPKRALLRIGMLLRHSEVARQVRTYLLDNGVTAVQSNIVQIPTELNLLGQISTAIQQSYKAMVDMEQRIVEATKEIKETKEENKQLKSEIDDVRNGLVDINLPLRTQFNDAVKEYKGKCQLDWNIAYNNIYKLLGKQNHVNIKQRAENQGKKPIEIIEELNLLVPAIRLAKTLSGVAS
ncbi:hypothetical protein [Paenibacillus sp. FSL E2-0151]|uniref:hypothetical protein n=1 Tax=Paenibacillus sp. FSL E2-0151 TaxID=2921357 RepID=UPI0030ED9512